jgi:anti-sigma factor ChrR (cupin superfamily)
LDVTNSVHTLCELAPLYALGALDSDELRAYQAHLHGCTDCLGEVEAFSRVADELALLTAAAPPASLKDRLLSSIASEPQTTEPPVQVWKTWSPDATTTDPMSVHRADAGGWETTGVAGITVRRLSVDVARQTASMLVRMEPGSCYPPHIHASAEECLVVEGELHVGDDLVMHAGDFQRAEGGTSHPVQYTETGCVLFISSSLHDELIP